ncbi:MAG: ATP synthase F1 subunit delta [Planctomycetota bacterium]
MLPTGIAKRYAEGLLKAGMKSNKINEIEENLFDFISCVWVNKAIRNFLMHPKLPLTIKEQFLQKIIGERYDILTIEFLKFLLKKDRIKEIIPITYEYDSLNDKYQGFLKVEVISAYPVTVTFLESLKNNLEEIVNRKIKFKVVVDKEMILGIKVRITDLVIENSLESKLKDFLGKIKIRG